MTNQISLFCGYGGIACGFNETFPYRILAFVTPEGYTDCISYLVWIRDNPMHRIDTWLNRCGCKGLCNSIRIRIKCCQIVINSILVHMRHLWMQIRDKGIMDNGRIESVTHILALPPTKVV